jgi:hypothetical protein
MSAPTSDRFDFAASSAWGKLGLLFNRPGLRAPTKEDRDGTIPWSGRSPGELHDQRGEREGDSELSSARKVAEVVNLSSQIERKDRRLPRFLVVPARLLSGWKLDGTTVVEATVNGVAIGRRSLKRWDDDRWFVELAQPMCKRAGVDTGDRVNLSLRLASDELPEELGTLLAGNRRAQAAWARLTPAQKRMLREEVLAAKSADTRRRRAERRLGVTKDGG